MIQLKFRSRWQEKNKITIAEVKFKLNYANRKTISSLGVYINGGNKIKGQVGALKNALNYFPRRIRTKVYQYYFTNQSNCTRLMYAQTG